MTQSFVAEPQGVDEIVKYQQAGRQTQFTPEIQKLASTFQGKSLDKTRQIIAKLKSIPVTQFDNSVFRKRTAGQILKDGFITGCTDSDLVFVALARASGLSVKYVETIDKSWLKKGGGSIQGHQYAEVYDEEQKKWIWVEPMGARVDIQPPSNDGREIYRVGLDSWDIGITDFDSLRQKFEEFRNSWLERNPS